MKELESTFIGTGEVKGFKFTQLHGGNAYLYEVESEEQKHYEVFERKESKDQDTVISGVPVHFDAKVMYPTSNAFGDWAFCIKDYEKAVAKYKELLVITEGKKV